MPIHGKKKNPVLLNFPAPRRMEEERERVQARFQRDFTGYSRAQGFGDTCQQIQAGTATQVTPDEPFQRLLRLHDALGTIPASPNTPWSYFSPSVTTQQPGTL